MDNRRASEDVPDRSGENVLLMKTWNDGEAAMIRQILLTYDIPCQVVSDVPHTVLPIAVDGLGEVRILVPASLLEKARSLIADHRRQGLEVLPGGDDPSETNQETADPRDAKKEK